MFTTSLLSYYCLGEGLRGRRVDRLETGPNSPPAWTGCLPLRRPESGREPVARSPHQRAMLLVTLAQTGKRGRQNNNGEGLETAEGEKRRERERENESSIAQVPWNAMEQQRGSRSDLRAMIPIIMAFLSFPFCPTLCSVEPSPRGRSTLSQNRVESFAVACDYSTCLTDGSCCY